MNKGVKFFLILILCMLLVGVVISGVGLTLLAKRGGRGVRRLANELFSDIAYSALDPQTREQLAGLEGESLGIIGGADGPTSIIVKQTGIPSFTRELSANFSDLEIEMKGAKLTILESDDESCHLKVVGLKEEEVDSVVEDGELRILDKRRVARMGVDIGNWHIGEGGLTLNDYEIRLYLPKGLSLDELKLELGFGETDLQMPICAKELSVSVGAGEFRASSLQADEAELEMGAGGFHVEELLTQRLEMECSLGETYIGSVRAEKEAQIRCAAGEVRLLGASLCDAKLRLGLGAVELQGELIGNCSLKQGAGDVCLKLSGDPSNLYVCVDKGVGEVELFENQVRARGASGDGCSMGNRHAKNRLEVSGGVGRFRVELN